MSDLTESVQLSKMLNTATNDAVAFESLFHSLHPRLVRYLSKELEGSAIDPEDVAQESLIKAWSKREQYDPRFQFSTWVYTIARRTALDHLRRTHRIESQSRLESTDEIEHVCAKTKNPDQTLQEKEQAEDLWKTARCQLKPEQFSVLWLRYGEDMTIREISKILNRSSVTIRVILHRARTKLQTHLEQQGETEFRGGNQS